MANFDDNFAINEREKKKRTPKEMPIKKASKKRKNVLSVLISRLFIQF